MQQDASVENSFLIKHDIQVPIRSVSITCDQEIIIFGAHRKILYRRINKLMEQRAKVKEQRMDYLGNHTSAANCEVQSIECNPKAYNSVANVSGNNILIWDLQSPRQQIATLSDYKQFTSISWCHADDKILATASQDNTLILWDVK